MVAGHSHGSISRMHHGPQMVHVYGVVGGGGDGGGEGGGGEGGGGEGAS